MSYQHTDPVYDPDSGAWYIQVYIPELAAWVQCSSQTQYGTYWGTYYYLGQWYTVQVPISASPPPPPPPGNGVPPVGSVFTVPIIATVLVIAVLVVWQLTK